MVQLPNFQLKCSFQAKTMTVRALILAHFYKDVAAETIIRSILFPIPLVLFRFMWGRHSPGKMQGIPWTCRQSIKVSVSQRGETAETQMVVLPECILWRRHWWTL